MEATTAGSFSRDSGIIWGKNGISPSIGVSPEEPPQTHQNNENIIKSMKKGHTMIMINHTNEGQKLTIEH